MQGEMPFRLAPSDLWSGKGRLDPSPRKIVPGWVRRRAWREKREPVGGDLANRPTKPVVDPTMTKDPGIHEKPKEKAGRLSQAACF